MPLINCEVNLILTWSKDWFISSTTGQTKLKTTDTKLFAPVVTLSAQDNVKLLQQLKYGFRKAINLNKYQSDPKAYAPNRYLNLLVNSSFKGVKRHCVKSVRIRSYSCPDFPAFGLKTERYSVSVRIKSECGKMRMRTTPNTDTFHTGRLFVLSFENENDRTLHSNYYFPKNKILQCYD